MSLHEKHLKSLEQKDFLQTRVEADIFKIKSDKSGACWHLDEVSAYMRKSAEKLDALTYEEKIKMPFYGLTVGMKDLFCISGLTTTAGSKILSSFKAPYDSTVWDTLSQKGALLGAKLAMDEFAMGSFSNTSYLGRVSLPGFPDRTAGGSSGGSGAALEANLVDFTTGSDTGGSVRLPAAFCSQVGYKPSYGAFSRYGMIAYASSLDQAGLLTHTLQDMKYLMDSDIANKDIKDMTSRQLPHASVQKSRKLKVGYFPEFFESDAIEVEIKLAYQDLVNKLKLTHDLIPVSIQVMDKAAQIYYILACSEASSNLARYQGVFFGEKLVDEKFEGTYWEQCAQYRSKFFGIEVQKRIMLGSFILSSENFSSMYQKAVKLRQFLKDEFARQFQTIDTLLLPTSPIVAPKWEEISKMTSAQIYMSDFMTVPFSLAGLPALSVPWYKSKEGLGIGMQFVGAYMQDHQLLEDILKIEMEITKEAL
jgi:aspartyl-tRNA(Asn)/glutamyl-tRNA(Gln) amidotransferase subunit A